MIFDYEILSELGRGTTGTVYEARHARLNRRVALKSLAWSAESEPLKAQRFLRRCQALAYLTQQEPDCKIPQLHEVAEDPAGRLFSVSQLIDGSTLGQRVAEGSIDIHAGLLAIAVVARTVKWVHEQGFAHRNLVPSNVLIDRQGTPWLIGFGKVGMLAGSQMLPPGAAGTTTEVDVQALLDMARWLCGALRQPDPGSLERTLGLR